MTGFRVDGGDEVMDVTNSAATGEPDASQTVGDEVAEEELNAIIDAIMLPIALLQAMDNLAEFSED